MKREFLMLAQTYTEEEYVGGWWVSEKLNGMRCFWDGGISRGKLKETVAWSNTQKDDRYLKQQVCTGLWSRYGNVIHAPDWWLDKLPINVPLDGELYMGVGKFQLLMSIVKDLEANEQKWGFVTYHIIDSPSYSEVFKNGLVNGRYLNNISFPQNIASPIKLKHKILTAYENEIVRIIDQYQLPNFGYQNMLNDLMDDIVSKGGEGLMIRNPNSIWTPTRSYNLLKYKRYLEGKGLIIGAKTGRGKYRGMMGSLIISWNGITFLLSGFTEDERRLSEHAWAYDNVGKECPDYIYPVCYPYGSEITFRYQELSDSGVPKCARYTRAGL